MRPFAFLKLTAIIFGLPIFLTTCSTFIVPPTGEFMHSLQMAKVPLEYGHIS